MPRKYSRGNSPSINNLKFSPAELAFHTERFWKKVIKTDSCWNWRNTKSKYGSFTINRNYFIPSRFSFELAFGKIEPITNIYRICRNDYCVNPEHLDARSKKPYLKKMELANA